MASQSEVMVEQLLVQMAPNAAGSSAQQQVPLSIAVLVFGLLIAAGVMFVMFRREKGWGPVSAQLVGLTLVITAGLLLPTAARAQPPGVRAPHVTER